MANPSSERDFHAFTRWLAAEHNLDARDSGDPGSYRRALVAAREARDETMRSVPRALPRFESLQLVAAATSDEDGRPPQLTTARGFKVTFAYEEGESPGTSSIAVLVQCPADMMATVQGETAYLWNGSERFALGQFDMDGKAIGTLPAGVEISLTDFTQGMVKLEEPSGPSE